MKLKASTALKRTQRNLKKRLKSGESKNHIGASFGVAAAEVTRIMDGKYPGESVARRLNMPVVCWLCKRPKKAPTTPRPRAVQPDYVREFMKLPLAERHEVIRLHMLARGAY